MAKHLAYKKAEIQARQQSDDVRMKTATTVARAQVLVRSARNIDKTDDGGKASSDSSDDSSGAAAPAGKDSATNEREDGQDAVDKRDATSR